jgi:prephenate dehydrogenase
MVICEARLDAWRDWVQQLLQALEAQCVYSDPQRHDDNMAAVQSLVHAAHLAQAAALSESTDRLGTPNDILPFRSVSFELDMAVASRILSSNPAIYSDIQFENPAALPMLDRFVETLTALRDCVADGSEPAREQFRQRFFDVSREHFGQSLLAEGNHSFERLGYLLADLSEPDVLDVHLINDRPGALRELLTLLEEHGVNLRSIHSSRTPTGEVHFQLACDPADSANSLQSIAETIETSGLGRRIAR